MPIWLRRFTFKKLKDYYDKQKETTSGVQDVEKVLKPNIQPKPTYTTKAKQATKK